MKKTVQTRLVAGIAICLLASLAEAQYSGGSGTAEDAYQITTAADLITLGETPEDYDKHFILTADIDLDPNLPGGKVFDRAVIAPDVNDREWFHQGPRFTGLFDGDDHTISHLTITGVSSLGLFGELGSGAKISNLALKDVDVRASIIYLAAQDVDFGEIADSTGALVGRNGGGTITSSYSTGLVSGQFFVGGLVGQNGGGTITSSYSTARVSGEYEVGGLVGEAGGSILSCYSTGSVSGDDKVGGLVGRNTGTLTSCYSIGTVSGNDNVGGLVGENDRDGTITKSCWDMWASGQATSAGGTGKTTSEMQDISTYLNEGWDFVDEILNGTYDYWQISPGEYPRLHYHADDGPVMPEGLGTATQPYLIRDARDLGTVGLKPLAHYRLETSLDLSGITWSMAVVPWFNGTFEGNGHVISNLHIQGGGNLGLFGELDSEAIISNLGLEAIDINGSHRKVGGLAGSNDGGSISNCYSTGTVTGNDDVGGLVGSNGGLVTLSYSTSSVSGNGFVGGLVGSSGFVTLSYSTGSVSGEHSVGGLVGYLEGSITSNYSTGTVSGIEGVGGLVGDLDGGSITSCYSTGSVSGDHRVGGLVGFYLGRSITSSFWDMETSGRIGSQGGFGLTTVEMMDPEILGLNGLLTHDPNWVLNEGQDYPRLAWEGTPGQVIPEPVFDWLDGQGTDQEPYRVDRADQLILLSRASVLWDKHFILGADIDLDPKLPGRRVFSQAAIQFFSGVFDGNGHTISHLTVSGGSGPDLFDRGGFGGLGLFGRLGSRAIVSNLGLEAVDIDGDRLVGGLAGSNSGSIANCYSTGMVNGNRYVGGLVGYNSGDIASSYGTGSASGTSSVGGLVGGNGGGITDSYSTGSVDGDDPVGGLVGSNRGSITSSFWDMEASGITVSDGGVGLTTAEMMDPYMLGLNSFANDPNWILDAGRDYPRLAWEGAAGQIIAQPVIDWLNGQGTEQEPYRIDTAEQLILLGKASILWDKHFILGANIDLDPNLQGRRVFSQALMQVFSGVFDGNGHTISHLTITGGTYLGLFGELAPGATVSNLGLEAVDVNGIGDRVAGLVGSNNEGSITACYSTGTVSGNDDIGGLVGVNDDGSITSCYSTGTVNGNNHVGGLVGVNNGDSITSCNSNSSVNGNGSVGGLVGYNDEGSITDSYSTGTVSGDRSVGGLLGRNSSDGSITMSHSTSAVNGNENVGGLVGGNSGGNIYDGSITMSYSTGPVSGYQDVGGLVGSSAGRITDCYSTGTVTGGYKVGGLVGYGGSGDITNSYSTGSVTGNDHIGGLVGRNGSKGSITSSVWDRNTSGQTTSPGGTRQTTVDMQTAKTFLEAGWDFVDETTNGNDDIWWIPEGRGYPRLWWETLYVDDDAPDDPGPRDPRISDPLEDGRQTHPFDSIQEAIDFAPDCLTVLVRPGQYLTPENDDNIDFFGKNITLSSSDPTNWDTVDSTVIRGAVQFGGTEGPDCKLTGFRIHDPYYGAIYGNHTRATISHCVISANGPCGATVIKDCDGTISNCLITDNTTFFSCGVFPVVSGCNGLIKNCTIANNISGVSVGTATIENCIIYHNAGAQLGVYLGETLSISYSNVQGGLEAIVDDGDVVWGPGNIDLDPHFVRLGRYYKDYRALLAEGDYHLRSAGWRWNAESGSWTDDPMTSLCVDAGDPDLPLGAEPLSVPRDLDNEWGENLRINMGAYGGTAQASMAPVGWIPWEDDE